MAEVRVRKNREGLVESARDKDSATEHLSSAGDDLIKALSAKQTATSTSLEEQLRIHQHFVQGKPLEPLRNSGLSLISYCADDKTLSSDSKNELCTIEELCNKSGLSRQELENQLSIKPNSEMAKLYRFALSNQSSSGTKSLLDLLPEHPINNLKRILEEFTCNLEKGKITKKGRKRRRRKKKVGNEIGCEARKEDCRSSCEGKSRICEEEEEEETKAKEEPQVSFWDVKELPNSSDVRIPPKRLFTIRDGVIVEVTH